MNSAISRPSRAIARGLAFVPALSGLACPWGSLPPPDGAGLSLETERRDLLQSILEGIAMRSAEVSTPWIS